MSNHRINNDLNYLESKILLRVESISNLQNINVLDLFGGEGILWNEVKKRTNKNIKILSIDKNRYNKVQLQGDNLKFIDSIDLNKFHVIDIDAWGSPFKQLDKVLKTDYKGIIHCTFIQTMMGKITNDLLFSLGYTPSMIDKIPSLFNKHGFDKFKYYLNKKGIEKINVVSGKNKHYLYFEIQ